MDVLIISDSKYVIEAIEKNGSLDGKRKTSRERKILICGSVFLNIPQHNVQFQWVKRT